jgi:hypothetical protein
VLAVVGWRVGIVVDSCWIACWKCWIVCLYVIVITEVGECKDCTLVDMRGWY